MPPTKDLFEDEGHAGSLPPNAPLAERMRPAQLEEIVGQDELLAPGSLLRRLIASDRTPSMILWGPPGSGKTTLARLLASSTKLHFVPFSAVLSGVKEVRVVTSDARERRRFQGQGTLLFVDEIHRFNKSQQDAFLPHVEDGSIVLVGATTENPSFALNAALVSRCQVFVLRALSTEALERLAERALDRAPALGLPEQLTFSPEARRRLAETANGDARTLLNRLEAVLHHAAQEGRTEPVGAGDLDAILKDRALRYDRGGEDHFNVMSALIKSMRGGDPQATVWWITRLLRSGEDRMWVARRLVRFASEDIGLADPQALPLALAARESWRSLGSPEGELALVQAAVHLATAPKSNAVYLAYREASADIEALGGGAADEVPLHLRNAPTSLMKQLGHGRGYLYPHDFDAAVAPQGYLPPALADRRWYRPSPYGHEKEIARRMEWWEKTRRALEDEPRPGQPDQGTPPRPDGG